MNEAQQQQQRQAAKRAAANAAANLIRSGMTVGLGTGSTATAFVEALGARVAAGELTVRGVPTSQASETLARRLGIETVPLGWESRPDITVDGADEIGPGLNLIKGGGGALVREKLVAAASRELIVIADASKEVPRLGAFPLPMAVFPFGWETACRQLTERFAVPASLRRQREPDGEPVITDDGLYLIDMSFGIIDDPERLQAQLREIVGVAEVGLFVGLATRAIVGQDDGRVVFSGSRRGTGSLLMP